MTRKIAVNVMAPLLVGDPNHMDSDASRAEWERFERDLQVARDIGVHGVSTDVWWGVIQPSEDRFDWGYYDRLADLIIRKGLLWIPILGFHQLGGNVGDKGSKPVPSWTWDKLARDLGLSPDALKFVSEQGNVSGEFISYWALKHARGLFKSVLAEFQNHFKSRAGNIAELNISLGPSGELRFPSYNSHDTGTDYPTRGGLQCYSSLALASVKQFAVDKYGSEKAAIKAWSDSHDGLAPPKDPAQFFKRGDHLNTAYGKDLFDWYQDSLLSGGRELLSLAFEAFAAEGAPFAGIDIGAKFPGIHWRIGTRSGQTVTLGDRLAELAAGLVRTSGGDWESDEMGRGYRPLLKLFEEFKGKRSRMVLHFTCLEMPDGDGKPAVKSLASTLVRWIGQESVRRGVPLKGENALSWNLASRKSWERMRSVLPAPVGEGPYEGLTLLRLSDCLANEHAKDELTKTVKEAQRCSTQAA